MKKRYFYFLVLFLLCSCDSYEYPEYSETTTDYSSYKDNTAPDFTMEPKNVIELLNKFIDKTYTADEGEYFCSHGFWRIEKQGGFDLFNDLANNDSKTIKQNSERTKGNRSVVTLEYYLNKTLITEEYLFLDHSSGEWLIDGMNSKQWLIPYYLDNKYNGHYSIYDLPEDEQLSEYGETLLNSLETKLSSGNFNAELMDFGSNSDLPIKKVNEIGLTDYGYDVHSNKGYFCFVGKYQNEFGSENYKFLTLYFTKQNHTINLLGYIFEEPSLEKILKEENTSLSNFSNFSWEY